MRIRALPLLLLLSAFASAQVMEWQEDPNAPNPRPVRQAAPPRPDHVVFLHCGALWDGKSDRLQQNVFLEVRGERTGHLPVGEPQQGESEQDE